jgi:hypothetical protein
VSEPTPATAPPDLRLARELVELLSDGRPRTTLELAVRSKGGVGRRREKVEQTLAELEAVGAVQSTVGRKGRSRATLYTLRAWDGRGPRSRRTRVAPQHLAACLHALTLDRRGFTSLDLIVFAAARATGRPLDPFLSDGAAVILRASTLLEHGESIVEALEGARRDLELGTGMSQTGPVASDLLIEPGQTADPLGAVAGDVAVSVPRTMSREAPSQLRRIEAKAT